jgi:histidinol-phosphate aminotransferase
VRNPKGEISLPTSDRRRNSPSGPGPRLGSFTRQYGDMAELPRSHEHSLSRYRGRPAGGGAPLTIAGNGPPDPLRFHGDAETADGLVDLAVNVRTEPMPAWLAEPIAASLHDLARYPDPTAARAAVAARHRRSPAEVLLTAGASQAFTLIAQAYAHARRPVVVHPQFTEPEAALRTAGLRPERVMLDAANGFRFDPDEIPAGADLVMIGNPTNPTSVAHAPDAIAGLGRPGRLLVVDEAFADTIPGEPMSLSARPDVPGLVVIRSLTKTWGLAGLRVGYVLAEPRVIGTLADYQPLWPVATPALAAIITCATPQAMATEEQIGYELAARRDHLLARLATVPAVRVPAAAASSFVLIRVPEGVRVRQCLRDRGFAVRRGETFPGLGPDWLRVAVRETDISDRFVEALRDSVADAGAPTFEETEIA